MHISIINVLVVYYKINNIFHKCRLWVISQLVKTEKFQVSGEMLYLLTKGAIISNLTNCTWLNFACVNVSIEI